MFTSLSDRLTATFKNLRGKGRLSESDVNKAVRDIRLALLDADVALPVVKSFTHAVRERALGAEVSQAPVSYTHLDVYKRQLGFRVTRDDEMAGIDQSEHAETAYDLGGLAAGRMGVGALLLSLIHI